MVDKTRSWVIDVCRTCDKLAVWPFCEHRDQPPPGRRALVVCAGRRVRAVQPGPVVTVRALVIPAGEEGEVRHIEPDLATLQGIVGGWIEAVNLGEGWHLYCNEEGKLEGLAPNMLATGIANILGWPRGDILRGDVVFLGDDPQDASEEGDVPELVTDVWKAITG